MDGWAHVRVGVELIKAADHLRQQVLPFKFRRAKLLTGGEQKINHNSRRIGEHYKIHHFFERRNIEEKRVRQRSHKPDEPKQVRNEKPFAEGNGVIQRAVNGIIFFYRIKPLNISEKQAEHGPEKQQQHMAELIRIQLAEPEFSVIHTGLWHKINPFRIKNAVHNKNCAQNNFKLYFKFMNKSRKRDKI